MTAFNPCLLIPVYNHGPQLVGTLASLEPFDLHCFLVDDGSDAETKAIMQKAAAARNRTLITLPRNGGKGAAFTAGAKAALEAGYTHAVQIDADGQHCSADLPRFLEASRENPEALILGKPIFDDSAPLIRVWGRKLSNLMGRIETLSSEIGDILYGYRVYPLASTVEVLEGCRSPRMDFDTEVAVRHYWRGTPMINIDTAVVYPPTGVSHFRMFRDNARLIWLNTRLTLEMPIHLPTLLRRRRARRAWFRRRERGSLLAFRFAFAVYRLCGRRIFTFFLYPITAYFYLTAGAARRASQQYLARVRTHPCSALPPGGDAALVFKHFFEFSRSIMDKVAVWNGDISCGSVQWENLELLKALVEKKQGAVLLGAHHGNIEVSRALSKEIPGVMVNALMFSEHAWVFKALQRLVHDDAHLRVIGLERIEVETVARLGAAVREGELLGILADRIAAGSPGRSRQVPFFGRPARFPEGPWVLASLLECPVYTIFCLREASGYRVHIEHFADRIELPRATREEALRSCMQRYAARLEEYCLRAPLQWYNFYEFWG